MLEQVKLWFATSNRHKFEEASSAMEKMGIIIARLPGKGEEVQSEDIAEIARKAAVRTFERVGKPLFTEDTGLFVESLNGFPGPYSSFAFKTIGLHGLIRLIQPNKGRSAEFVSAVAHCSRSSRPRVFVGKLKGRISSTPRGRSGFGFDPVFIPEGWTRTLGEMTLAEKAAISHRSMALKALGESILSNKTGNLYLPNGTDSAS